MKCIASKQDTIVSFIQYNRELVLHNSLHFLFESTVNKIFIKQFVIRPGNVTQDGSRKKLCANVCHIYLIPFGTLHCFTLYSSLFRAKNFKFFAPNCNLTLKILLNVAFKLQCRRYLSLSEQFSRVKDFVIKFIMNKLDSAMNKGSIVIILPSFFISNRVMKGFKTSVLCFWVKNWTFISPSLGRLSWNVVFLT